MRVTIDRLGINGEGVFRITDSENAGKVGFVFYALPEEVVDIDIVKDKSKFCEATLTNVIESSLHRKEPICPYFNKCGGCELQHMNNSLQLQFKKSKVEDALKKISKLQDFVVCDCIHVNDVGYRNKMVFPFGILNEKSKIGMYEKNSHKIVDINCCLLADQEINTLYKLCKGFFEQSAKYKKYISEKILKYLVIRYYKNNYLITLVVSKKIDVYDFIDLLSNKIKSFGVSIIIGDSDNEILSGKYEHVFGLKKLNIDENGIKYNIDNRGFLQVNNEIKSMIYDKILNEIDAQDNVIDAYSGAGLLSAILAKKCKNVVGIEINTSASKSAQELAKINNLHNIKFYNADVKNKISDCLEMYDNTVLVLDPARSGCEDIVLDKILSANLPKKIIYLSCNVATLARDLLKLKENYKITEIIPYDMFPNTKHVETLVVMNRIN